MSEPSGKGPSLLDSVTDDEVSGMFRRALSSDRVPAVKPAAAPAPAVPTAPAPQDRVEWYVSLDEQQVGPLTPAAVSELWASGRIKLSTLCWREGLETWKEVSQVPEFVGLLAQVPSPAPEPTTDVTEVPRPALSSLVQDELQALSKPQPKPEKPAEEFPPLPFGATEHEEGMAGLRTLGRRPLPPERIGKGLWIGLVLSGLALVAAIGAVVWYVKRPAPVRAEKIAAPPLPPPVQVAPPPPPVAKPVETPKPIPSSAPREKLTPKDVMDVVVAHRARVVRCVEAHQEMDPDAEGKIVMRWNIELDGTVSSALAEGDEFRGSLLEGCLSKEITSWTFPVHRQPFDPVVFPFKF